MMPRTKAIISAAVAIFLILSGISFLTLPKPIHINDRLVLGQIVNYPLLPQANLTFYDYGQSATYSFLASFPIANWTSDQFSAFQLYMVKRSQNVTFPFNEASIVVSHVTLQTNGTTNPLSSEQNSLQDNGSVYQKFYYFTSLYSYNGSTSFNISFQVTLDLVFGIYYMPVNLGTYYITKDFKLGR